MNNPSLPHQATVVGLGSFGGNLAACQYLLQQGVKVKLTDKQPRAAFDSALQQSVIRQCECYFDGHPAEAFRGSEMIVVNPVIRSDDQIVCTAIEQGVLVTSEIELFLGACPATVIGVTGTNGKSTTATLIHHLLRESNQPMDFRTYLGGNIGHSLLPDLPAMTAADVVIVELSSFQLMQLKRIRFAPHVAVLTNFTPNHLDWHRSLSEYQAAKQVLFDYQSAAQWAILPEADDNQWKVRGRQLRHGIDDFGEDGVFLSDGSVVIRVQNQEDAFRWVPPVTFRAAHQQKNLTAALAAVYAIGLQVESAIDNVRTAPTLEHRLQRVAEVNQIQFVNDSNSTTPESTMAALQSISNPVVLIAGGSDKGTDLREMAKMIAKRCCGVILVGATAQQLYSLIKAHETAVDVVLADSLSDAVERAVALVPTAGMVLLSPGCASFGMFRDYRDRGDQFCQLVRQFKDSQ